MITYQKETKQALAAQYQKVILGKDAPYVELSFVHSSNKHPVNLFLCAGVYFCVDVCVCVDGSLLDAKQEHTPYRYVSVCRCVWLC